MLQAIFDIIGGIINIIVSIVIGFFMVALYMLMLAVPITMAAVIFWWVFLMMTSQ